MPRPGDLAGAQFARLYLHQSHGKRGAPAKGFRLSTLLPYPAPLARYA